MEVTNFDLFWKYLSYFVYISVILGFGLFFISRWDSRKDESHIRLGKLILISICSLVLSFFFSFIPLIVYLNDLHGPNELAFLNDNLVIDTQDRMYQDSGYGPTRFSDYTWVKINTEDFYTDPISLDNNLNFEVKVVDNSVIRTLKFNLDGINFTGSNYQRYLFIKEVDKQLSSSYINKVNRFNWINKLIYNFINDHNQELSKFNNQYDNLQQTEFDLLLRDHLTTWLKSYGIELTKPIKFRIKG